VWSVGEDFNLFKRRRTRSRGTRRWRHPEIPPRVEFALTDLGRTLTEPLDALWNWAAAHQDEVKSARAAYDGAHGEAEHRPAERRYAGAPL
jgi:hypothetical protein